MHLFSCNREDCMRIFFFQTSHFFSLAYSNLISTVHLPCCGFPFHCFGCFFVTHDQSSHGLRTPCFDISFVFSCYTAFDFFLFVRTVSCVIIIIYFLRRNNNIISPPSPISRFVCLIFFFTLPSLSPLLSLSLFSFYV